MPRRFCSHCIKDCGRWDTPPSHFRCPEASASYGKIPPHIIEIPCLLWRAGLSPTTRQTAVEAGSLRNGMPIDKAKCKAYWAEFVASLPDNDPRIVAEPDAFSFGGEGEIADELAALVLAGKKRATASLPVEYTSLGEALPKTGDLSIVLEGRGSPVAIIERTSVEVVPFHAVTAEFAATEGEGDGSLKHWKEAHTWYFGQVCERLGGTLEATTPVLCQRFKLVWPTATRDADAV